MAIGKHSDFVVFDEQFYGGYVECIADKVDVFGEASGGALRFVPRASMGQLSEESFFKTVSGLVSRRDSGSTSAATDKALTMEKFIAPKLDRKIGPVGQTLDSWRKIGEPEQLSFILGQQAAKAVMDDALKASVDALVACLTKSAALKATTPAKNANLKLKTTHLLDLLRPMGDAAERIVAFIMDAANYFDLVEEQMTSTTLNVFRVGDMTIYEGTPATLGRRVIVTDSPNLRRATNTNEDSTVLGLTDMACVVEESETPQAVMDVITGLENIVGRYQAEYAISPKVKGFAYTDAGMNPTSANLRDVAHWARKATDVKDCAGTSLSLVTVAP